MKFTEEGAHDLFTGEVCGVQNAVVAVSAFKVKVKLRLVFGRRCELDAPLHELLDSRGTVLHENFHGVLFAKTCTCFEGVCHMEFKFVCFFGDRADTALSVVR